MRSLTEIAHGLDAQVIAESVETEAEWLTLKVLCVNGVQGHLVGAPRRAMRS